MHAVIALAVFATAAWNLPAPDKTEHPGAKTAPACDPRSYQDEAGFQSRAKLVINGLAPIDPLRWRQDWFRTGGDPGKYVPPVCMAKLLVNPDDQVARQYMNDDRSYAETYHFAVINWARFLPLFGDSLTPETKRKFAEAHGRGNRYFDQQGTENHKIMWLAAANVLPSYVAGNRLADVSVDGKPISAGEWPIYGGPFVTQAPGVLTVTDGSNGYTVDFTGDLPVYSTSDVRKRVPVAR